jgi:hypothetical protein
MCFNKDTSLIHILIVREKRRKTFSHRITLVCFLDFEHKWFNIVFFSVYIYIYKLPKGLPTFIARLTDAYIICDVVHSPITIRMREAKRTQKDLSWLLAMTHTHVYKRSITFQVCSFYCAEDLFLLSEKFFIIYICI